ncbi:MAG: nucleotide sugar dehydrogenase [Methyloceanibacter sp.]|uniref:nucleotide sugar dehydrogenase n=1 Tax=Methyloceanibacter sp. TaxID=1965321 RepID=UPI003D9B4B38
MSLPVLADVRIGVIGLGYVGLPLAVYLARHFPVLGFDIDSERVAELNRGLDRTREVTEQEFAKAAHIAYAADVESLRDANVYIVTVPTPVDQAKRPDLSALIAASRMVGTVLTPGNVVIYESTVYPGATEEICVPALEKESGLTFNRGFFAGYSPERINPGDKTHRLPDIVKVVSGSTQEAMGACSRLGRWIIRRTVSTPHTS